MKKEGQRNGKETGESMRDCPSRIEISVAAYVSVICHLPPSKNVKKGTPAALSHILLYQQLLRPCQPSALTDSYSMSCSRFLLQMLPDAGIMQTAGE